MVDSLKSKKLFGVFGEDKFNVIERQRNYSPIFYVKNETSLKKLNKWRMWETIDLPSPFPRYCKTRRCNDDIIVGQKQYHLDLEIYENLTILYGDKLSLLFVLV